MGCGEEAAGGWGGGGGGGGGRGGGAMRMLVVILGRVRWVNGVDSGFPTFLSTGQLATGGDVLEDGGMVRHLLSTITGGPGTAEAVPPP